MKHVGKGRLFLNVSSVMMIVIVMVMGVVDVDDGYGDLMLLDIYWKNDEIRVLEAQI